jgi:hypothetical protein
VIATSVVLGLLVLSVALGFLAAPYYDGPPPGYSGGFGEPTCVTCHLDAPVNEPGGAVRITGVPEVLDPGNLLHLQVQLQREEFVRGGFQFTSRWSDGRQAGSFYPIPDHTVVVDSAGIEYLSHAVAAGLDEVKKTVRWYVIWQAPPDSAGAVYFHVAANASNGDGSVLGDWIYLAEASTGLDSGGD